MWAKSASSATVHAILTKNAYSIVWSSQFLMSEHRRINQGDVFWIQLADPDSTEPGIPHPYVVVQDNIFNYSRIHTVIVCALTSNIKRASLPGNVLLEPGEANLTKQSVVEVSKVSSVNKSQLGEYIGSLSAERINEIFAGMRFLQQSFFAHKP
jgi:mRNA interferase MazF